MEPYKYHRKPEAYLNTISGLNTSVELAEKDGKRNFFYNELSYDKPEEFISIRSKGMVPMNTSQIMRRELYFAVAPFDSAKGKSGLARFIEENWKDFYKTKAEAIDDWNKARLAWASRSFTTGDGALLHPEGKMKLMTDYKKLTRYLSKDLTESDYRALGGKEFSIEDFGKIKSKKDAKNDKVWKTLSRSQALLNEFADYAFSENDDAMRIFTQEPKANKLEIMLWKLNGSGKDIRLTGMDGNRLIGISPEIARLYSKDGLHDFRKMRKMMEELADSKYGGPILKRLAKKYMGIGLSLAIAVHFTGIGLFWGSEYLNRSEENNAPVVMLKYSELGPPPSIVNQQALPKIAINTPIAKPNVGIPVPVPDASVSPEQTIATQKQLSKIAGPITSNGGNGDSVGVLNPNNLRVNDNAPPPNFVPVEKQPVVIKNVTPQYPVLAKRAGIEGKVWVKVWVDKTGKPREALILKSDAAIFDEAAIKAAMQDRFTPAIMNHGPVDVWVVIPYTFKLQK